MEKKERETMGGRNSMREGTNTGQDRVSNRRKQIERRTKPTSRREKKLPIHRSGQLSAVKQEIQSQLEHADRLLSILRRAEGKSNSSNYWNAVNQTIRSIRHLTHLEVFPHQETSIFRTPIQLENIIREATDVISVQLNKEEIIVHPYLTRPIDGSLLGDENGLREILCHVLQKAKHETEQGIIELAVTPDIPIDELIRVKFRLSYTAAETGQEKMSTGGNFLSGLRTSRITSLLEKMGSSEWLEELKSSGKVISFDLPFRHTAY